MSYGVKFRCTHKAKTNQTETTFKVDILKDGYSGAVTEVLGFDDVFEFEYEKIDPTKLHSTPIQSGRLDFKYLVRDATDYQLLTDIFDNDEGTFKMRLYRDDALLFEGFVLNDMLEISEADYPHQSHIVAKDFTKLKGRSYTLTTDTTYVTVSDLIEDLISPIRDSRAVNYFTSFVNSNVSGDFLDGVYVDKFGIRDFKDVENRDDDLALDRYEVLESLLKSFGLLMRQAEGEFQVYQLSGLSSLATTTVDSSTNYVLPSSITQFNAGVKRAKFAYNHRTVLKEIKMPDKFFLLYDSDTESVEQGLAKSRAFSQLYNSDQDIKLKFRVDSDFPIPTTSTGDLQDFTDLSNRFGRFQIKVVAPANTYYFKLDASQNANILNAQGSWVTEETTNAIRLIGGGQIEGTDLQRYSNVLNLDITDVPAEADGNLTITFFNSAKADMNNGRVQEFILPSTETHIFVNDFAIEGADNRSNSETLAYEIEQDGDFSNVYDHGGVLFGEGPVTYSPLALFYDDSGTKRVILGGWNRGSGATKTLAELLLEEIIGIQSRGTKNLSADFYGNYNGHNKLSYDSVEYFFIGGVLNGSNIFRANFIELDFQTATLGDLSEVAEGVRGSSINGTSTADLVSFREGVKVSEFFNSIFLSNFVGELSTAINAGSTITSFVANLSAQLQDGEDFVLIDKINEKPYHVNVVGNYNAGQNVTVTIDEQYIATDLAVGSPIILSGGLVESYFTVDPNKLLISVQTRDESFYYGKINETYNGQINKTSLSLVNSDITSANQAVFNDGQVLRLRREDGESQLVTVDGDQSFTSSPYTLQLVEFQTDFLVFGVETPQFAKYKAYIEPTNGGSSIEFLKGRLILSADGSGGLAQIRLDGTGTSSSITLDADNINVIGQTTFTSGLVGEGLETQSGAQSKANSAQSAAEAYADGLVSGLTVDELAIKNEMAQALGFADFASIIASAVQNSTLIVGGFIDTTLINTDAIFANNLVISSTGSIQSSVYSSGSDGFKINADGTAEFNNVSVRSSNFSSLNSGFELTGSGLQFNENITIGSTGGIGTFEMYNPTIFTASGNGTAFFHRPQSSNALVQYRSNTLFISHKDYATLDGSGNEVGAQLFFGFYTGGASPTSYMSASGDGSFTFHVAGDITYTGSISQSSDANFKENVVPLGNTLDKITQLEAKVYDMVNDDEREIGLFAQDVEPLFPEAVNTVTRPNEEGEEITYKTLSYIQLIPALIESIKELKQQIDQLKNG